MKKADKQSRKKKGKRASSVLPAKAAASPVWPDFLARQRKIFGKKRLKPSGAEVIAMDREERF